MKRNSESLTPSNKQIDQSNTTTRINIDELCSDLTSTIFPHEDDKDTVSQADQIERATNYIVELKERVEGLNKRKEQLQTMVDQAGPSNYQSQLTTPTSLNSNMSTSRLPTIQVKEIGTSLEVRLVMEVGHNNIMLHQIITILEEEGAEVINATSYTSGNQVTHTLHAKARSARVGIEASRVGERLHGLM